MAANGAATRAMAVTRSTVRTCAETRWGGPRILLVDDDETARDAMCAFLAAEGYRVAHAIDGTEGLRRLRFGADPSLIVLDYQMPRMNGRDFRLEQLRDPRLARIPVIICSADEKPADLAPLSVQEWLRKPIDPPQLLATLRYYVAPAPSDQRRGRDSNPR